MNMKKTAAAILIMVILVSSAFAGCKKQETGEKNTTTTSNATTTTTTTATTTTTNATPTTATSTSSVSSTENATKAKVIKTALTEKDKKNLSSFLAYFIDYGSSPLPIDKKESKNTRFYDDYDFNVKYSCKAADAIDMAYSEAYGRTYYTIFDELAEECGWIKEGETLGLNNEDYFIRSESERDPQKKLEGSLIKIKADKFDDILETVFNVKPDRSYKLYDYRDGDKKLAGYYDNGWFYAQYGYGGDGIGPLVKLKSIDKQSDGKYIVKAEYLIGNDYEGYDHMANFKAEVALKDYCGDRIWSIYSMEKM